MSRKPHWPRAFHVEPAKITNYLLDPDHEDGGPKCEFLRPFGFCTYPGDLFKAIHLHRTKENFFSFVEGIEAFKLYFHGELVSPETESPNVRTVWQVDDADPTRTARFITLKPLPKLKRRSEP